MSRSTSFLLLLPLALAAATSAARADSIGITVQAQAYFDTNGIFLGSGYCGDPNYPTCTQTVTNQGLTAASAIASQMGTTGPNTNPAGTTSSAFASVSASEGHVGMSASADTEGIGRASGFTSGSWMDVVTVGAGNLNFGDPVTLEARLGIDAEFVGLGHGYGSAQAQGCFKEVYSLFSICTSGADSSSGPLTLPAVVTEQFNAYVGETLSIQGSASAEADSDSVGDNTGGTTSWSVVATNSAHFSIESLTPGVTLTTESGCSITSGYGCDAPPSGTVPEPSAVWLLLTGLAGLALFGLRLRRQADLAL